MRCKRCRTDVETEYAQRGCRRHTWCHQQDSVGLVAFDSEIRSFVRASSNPSHLKEILHVMEGVAAGAKPRPGRSSRPGRAAEKQS